MRKQIADCIKQVTTLIIKEFRPIRQSNVFVTDNARNMKAAFRDYKWISCSCHNLNLVLSNDLQ